jgi:hypothetical protein
MEPTEITLESTLFNKNLRVYEFDPNNVPYNKFGDLQGVCATVPAENPVYTLKPNSITFFTTDYQVKSAPVEAKGVTVQDGTLTWEPVSDPNHCYYRIYAGDTQIASTVACDLPVEDESFLYGDKEITAREFDGATVTHVEIHVLDEEDLAARVAEQSEEVNA